MKTTARINLRQWLCAGFVSAAALAFISGCQESPGVDHAAQGEAWKAHIAEAFEHNDTLTGHRFRGELVLDADGWLEPWNTAGLLPALSNGLAWEGTIEDSPRRLEANLAFGTQASHGEAAGAASFDIPILMRDETLYFHVPLLNEPEEYFYMDMQQPKEDSPLPAQALIGAADALDELMQHIVERVDPQYVRLAAADEPAAGPGEQTFEIRVTEENAAQLAEAIRQGWSAWRASFPAAIAGEPGASVQPADLELPAGSAMTIVISPDQYVVEQRMDLALPNGKLYYAVSLSDLNGSFEPSRTIPENLLSFNHVLTFLAAGRANDE